MLFPLWAAITALGLAVGAALDRLLSQTLGGLHNVTPRTVVEALGLGFAVVVVAVLIFAFRDDLRQHELVREVRPLGSRIGLVALGGISLLLVPLLAAAVTALNAWFGAHETNRLAQMIGSADAENSWRSFTDVALGLFWPATTAAVMLFGVKRYTDTRNERFPRPLYTDTHRLTRVVINRLQHTFLQQYPLAGAAAGPGAVMRTDTGLEVESLTRRDDGGLDLTIRQSYTTLKRDNTSGEFIPEPGFSVFEVTSDQWGTIRKFAPRARKIRLAIYDR